MENKEKIIVINKNLLRQTAYHMKWFKFMIYFLLWATAIWDILVGHIYIIRTIVKMIYTIPIIYTELRFWDIFWVILSKSIDYVYGIVMILIGICLILTRFKMKRYKKDGPEMYYYTYGIYIIAYFAYNLWDYYIMADVDRINDKFIIVCIMTIVRAVVLQLNDRYFFKRESLFCN